MKKTIEPSEGAEITLSMNAIDGKNVVERVTATYMGETVSMSPMIFDAIGGVYERHFHHERHLLDDAEYKLVVALGKEKK